MQLRRIKTVIFSLVLLLFGISKSFAFYNPQTGRWLSRDPAIENGADNQFAFSESGNVDANSESNPYHFVLNDPISIVDLVGLAGKPDKTKPGCGCKCKSVEISYTPKRKKGNLSFEIYKNPNTKGKQYGFTLHVKWTVEGDPSLCTFGVNEPPGGVSGTTPEGPVQPSSGTGGLWISVPQNWDDHPGIPVKSRGQYSIDVNLTQTYGCWEGCANPSKDPPTMTVGPMNYVGSGTKKY